MEIAQRAVERSLADGEAGESEIDDGVLRVASPESVEVGGGFGEFAGITQGAGKVELILSIVGIVVECDAEIVERAGGIADLVEGLTMSKDVAGDRFLVGLEPGDEARDEDKKDDGDERQDGQNNETTAGDGRTKRHRS